MSGSECWDPPFFGGYLWSKVPFFGPCLGRSLGRARFGNSSASSLWNVGVGDDVFAMQEF